MKRYKSQMVAAVFGVAVLGAIPMEARAAGFYTGVQGGASLMYDTSTRATAPSQSVGTTPGTSTLPIPVQDSQALSTHADTGWLAGASAGYEWPIGLALEGEFTFRQNHLDHMSANGYSLFAGGDEHSYAMMMNGYYRWHNRTRFTPYIGAGVGEAVIVLNNLHPPFGGGDFSGTDASFAYQGIGGVSYSLTEHISLAAEYRYFAALEPSFTGNAGGVKNIKLSPGYSSNDALLRLNYNF